MNLVKSSFESSKYHWYLLLWIILTGISQSNGKILGELPASTSTSSSVIVPSPLLAVPVPEYRTYNSTSSADSDSESAKVEYGVATDSNIDISDDNQAKDGTVTSPTRDINAMEQWKNLGARLRDIVDLAFRQMLPSLLEVTANVEISPECTAAGLEYFLAVRSLEHWAIRMVDASGKIPAGILDGSLVDLGDYDECVRINVRDKFAKSDSRESIRFQGQYCTLQLQPYLPPKPREVRVRSRIFNISKSGEESLFADAVQSSQFLYAVNFRLGVCVPSPCTRREIEDVAKAAAKGFGLQAEVPRCEARQSTHISATKITIICIILLTALLVITGTATDIYIRKNGIEVMAPKTTVKLMELLLAFSACANARKLVDNKASCQHIKVLHGLRFITMAWIILAHTYFFNMPGALGRMSNLLTYMDHISFQVIMNGWIAVDTFFFIGGLTLSYSLLKAMETSKGNISLISILIRRYWRIAPAMMMSVAFTILLPLLGNGPLWQEIVGEEANRCQRNWWANLLFISNWRWVDKICLTTTWYLCADMQLYLLATLILIPLYRKWPTIAMAFNIIFVIISMVVLASMTLAMDLKPSGVSITPDIELARRMAYFIHWKPYTHLGPYCIGIATGYLIVKLSLVTISTRFCVLGWAVSLVLGTTALFGSYEWNRGNDLPKAAGAIYAATHRVAWALGIAWVTYICAIGKGGIVSRLLSLQCFLPLSRLTYAAYLVHPLVIIFQVGYGREEIHARNYEMALMFVSHLGITIVLALGFALLFEYPFGSLEKVLYTSKSENLETTKSRIAAREVIENLRRNTLSMQQMPESKQCHFHRNGRKNETTITCPS